MKKIEKPHIKQEDVCNEFQNLKYKEIILEGDKEYENELHNVGELYDKEFKQIQNDKEYLAYMKKMYKERFSNKQYANLYKYYSEIRTSQKVCPYCNFSTREVKQIDHFLPKSKFPSLAITVKNLVPICKECNELKGNYFGRDKLNQLVHPYYGIDSEDIYEFLKCDVIENDNIGFKFYIQKLDKWDDITFNNVKFHFDKLKLDELYLVDFQVDFEVALGELKRYLNLLKDIHLVRKLFKEKIDAIKDTDKVPWRYIGFNSLMNNEWFFNVYLKNIINS